MIDTLLAPFRVLDLTDEKGFLCGKILADLGADVVKVEPPGGDPSRDIGPFYHDSPDRQMSLYWFAYNANKRGITLDIKTPAGRELFKRLARAADFVVESFPPGCMDGMGLGYDALSKINPRIIMTSITPFGQTGPYSEFKASDITVTAMSGYMSTCGDRDRPPIRISFPLAYLHAGAEAAAATLFAHYHRELSGEGQWVDVSAQQCLVWLLLDARPYWDVNGVIVRRSGPGRLRPTTGVFIRGTWPCKDGYVCFLTTGGAAGAPGMRALVRLAANEGLGGDQLKQIDWDKFDFASLTDEVMRLVEEPVGKFFRDHTKEELFNMALVNGIMLYPVSTSADLFHNTQLVDRCFWVELSHPELDASLLYPGPFVRSSEGGCSIRRRAPLIGENNQEIYEEELGMSKEDMQTLHKSGVI
jgi:crotonobetainyl-CoA:carnitine CoA-transferase CaiB-like acyl-CoA transferase